MPPKDSTEPASDLWTGRRVIHLGTEQFGTVRSVKDSDIVTVCWDVVPGREFPAFTSKITRVYLEPGEQPIWARFPVKGKIQNS